MILKNKAMLLATGLLVLATLHPLEVKMSSRACASNGSDSIPSEHFSAAARGSVGKYLLFGSRRDSARFATRCTTMNHFHPLPPVAGQVMSLDEQVGTIAAVWVARMLPLLQVREDALGLYKKDDLHN